MYWPISQHLPPDYKIGSASEVIENRQYFSFKFHLRPCVEHCIYQWMHHTVDAAFYLLLVALSCRSSLQQEALFSVKAHALYPALCLLVVPATAVASLPALRLLVE